MTIQLLTFHLIKPCVDICQLIDAWADNGQALSHAWGGGRGCRGDAQGPVGHSLQGFLVHAVHGPRECFDNGRGQPHDIGRSIDVWVDNGQESTLHGVVGGDVVGLPWGMHVSNKITCHILPSNSRTINIYIKKISFY